MQKRPKMAPSRSSDGERARDLAKGVMGEAQLLGEQLERGVAPLGVRCRQVEVPARALQRIRHASRGQ